MSFQGLERFIARKSHRYRNLVIGPVYIGYKGLGGDAFAYVSCFSLWLLSLCILQSTDIPEPVVIVKADIADQKITFTWNKPEENGAAITQYTIYKRNVNDQKWTKVAEIKDISNRVFVLQMDRVKTYEIVVTATNKYGESSVIKENIKTIKFPDDGGTCNC